MKSPRFIVDDMLGKLAKWLRIAGFDTLYFRKIENQRLIDLALKENRILLTRDTDIAADKKARSCILIIADNYLEQLRQVFNVLKLSLDREKVFSRCLIGNKKLEATPREYVREKVPEFVFQTRKIFSSCPECKRIYWQATHAAHVEKTLEKLV